MGFRRHGGLIGARAGPLDALNLVIRLLLLLLLLRAPLRRRRRTGLLEESALTRWVWPNDVDLNGHMNNGRYLAVMDLGFRLPAAPGATASGALTVTRAGSYELYCAVPGHWRAGMSATLIVT